MPLAVSHLSVQMSSSYADAVNVNSLRRTGAASAGVAAVTEG